MDTIVKGVKAKKQEHLIKFECGHEVLMGCNILRTELCPKCKKKLAVARERHKRSLPYYLKTDI